MRSASAHQGRLRTVGAGALLLAAAGPLAGCSTTMQTAARLQLNDARIRATSLTVLVPPAAASTSVHVTGLQVVSGGDRVAYVVTLRNAGTSAISDLPISVGYTTARHVSAYVNAQANQSYFGNHLPAVGAGRQITWVYTAGRAALPPGTRPFARVGAKAEPPAGRASGPTIAAAASGSGQTATGELLAVRVRNLSGVPQYQLPVYAFAQRDGRLVAAGTTSVTTLDGGSEQTVHLSLLGDAGGARLTVEALPTIFN